MRSISDLRKEFPGAARRVYLDSAGIDMSVRYTSGIGGLRISTHIYNNDDDVDRLIDVLRSLRRN